MTKTISHTAYEQLRTYPTEPTQHTVYRNGGFHTSLIAKGLLAYDNHGGVTMTDAGRAALVAYRERWGVPA